MSIRYFGKVAICGVDGTIAWTGYGSASVGATANIPQSISFSDGVDVVTLMDKRQEEVGKATRNKRKVVNIEVVPVNADGTATLVNARANQVLPAIGAQVVLAGFGGPASGEGSLNDTYQYWGDGTESVTPEGHVRLSFQASVPTAGLFTEILT